MSRLDDIERRLAALEAGGDVATRLKAVEETLGLTPGAVTVSTVEGVMQDCARCGQTQNINTLTCAQAKCPLK